VVGPFTATTLGACSQRQSFHQAVTTNLPSVQAENLKESLFNEEASVFVSFRDVAVQHFRVCPAIASPHAATYLLV
jgi:hypothetical protein